MKRLFLPLLTAALTLTLSALPAAAQLPPQPHIIVEGLGQIEQIPDLAIIRFEVVSTAADASTAKQNVDGIVGAAIAAATAQRVPESAIKASKINAAAQYDWHNQSRVYKGERVSRQVEITLADTERYNDLIDALLATGISQLQSPQLAFSHRRQLQHKALKLALDDAKDRAGLMAQHLGEKLGRVFQIAPVTAQTGPRPMAMRAESVSTSAGLKLGEQTIEQKIRVVYLLAD